MAIVPAPTALVQDNWAVTLPRYARLIEYAECPFFGVHDPSLADNECRVIWGKHERDTVVKYLREAQEEIEEIIRYPLHRRWFTAEQHPYTLPLVAAWGHIVAGGVRGSTDISLGEAVIHAADPATIGPVATTVTDTTEIRVYHPGSDVEIHPSVVTITAGNLTITIPRCRMVAAAVADNPSAGLAYTNLANFEATVDIKRVYNDVSTNADLAWQHGRNCRCTPTCTEDTHTACIYVKEAEIGTLDVLAANYTAGAWSRRSLSCCCSLPEVVRVNYYAGLETLTYKAEDAIMRLAHSKMPYKPCDCSIATRVWQRDRNTPEIMTRERLNCPFGLSDGAWIAWRFVMTMRLFRGGVL